MTMNPTSISMGNFYENAEPRIEIVYTLHNLIILGHAF